MILNQEDRELHEQAARSPRLKEYEREEIKLKTMDYLASGKIINVIQRHVSGFQHDQRAPMGIRRQDGTVKQNVIRVPPDIKHGWLSTRGAVEFLQLIGRPISYKTLEKYRLYGGGPHFRLLGGGSVRELPEYHTQDLIDWAKRNPGTSRKTKKGTA